MRSFKSAVLISALIGSVFGAGQFGAQAEEVRANFSFPGTGICPPTGMAWAEIHEDQHSGTTRLTIHVENAKPNEFYGVWIRLNGESPFKVVPVKQNGVVVGFRGFQGTALAPTTAINDLLAVTPPNPGSTNVINGFFTNNAGNGRLNVELDFLLSDGVYPFQKYRQDLLPVPLITANDMKGGTLRIVSHCTDHLGHGLVPGTHEAWFDWALP